MPQHQNIKLSYVVSKPSIQHEAIHYKLSPHNIAARVLTNSLHCRYNNPNQTDNSFMIDIPKPENMICIAHTNQGSD